MDRIRDIWGARTPFASGTAWPERVDEFLVDGVAASEVERWVRGACLLCSNGCGLEIAVRDGRMVGVRGRAEDRVNHGRLGPKGLYGWQGEQHERLTTPLIRQSGRLVETDWETAMSEVVARSRALLDAKGALSHGFFTCGQLMTEEYYTLAVIGKGGLGTPHMDGNTRWCTATASAAFKESFGCDGQPGSYTDIDSCDAIVLVRAQRRRNPNRAVDADARPARRRGSAADDVCRPAADQRSRNGPPCISPIRNGTNMALMNALVHEQIARGWLDEDYVDAHTIGFDELEALTRDATPQWAAEACGMPAEDIRAAARKSVGTSQRVCVDLLAGLLPVPPGHRRLLSRSTICTCCAACWADRVRASCR